MSLPNRTTLDDATATRLRWLRTQPVDLTNLKASIEQQIPRSRPGFIQRHLLLVRAMAASVVLGVVVVLLVLSLGSNEVLASPALLAQLHRETVFMPAHGQVVKSIPDAQAALTRDWPAAPDLPSTTPDQKVMSCCIHMIGAHRIASVRLKVDGQDVSVSVTDADNFRLPEGQTVHIAGNAFTVQSHDGLNMLMGRQGDRFLCVISTLPVERLERVTADLMSP